MPSGLFHAMEERQTEPIRFRIVAEDRDRADAVPDRKRESKTHLTEQPERLRLNLYGLMRKKRRDVGDVVLPCPLVLCQRAECPVEF